MKPTIQLNNDFLAQIGLADLPQDDKRKMLQHIYETLEKRVGMRLARQMSEHQLDEFEKFVDGDKTFATEYLTKLGGDWQKDPVYIAQRSKAEGQGKPAEVAISEFAALKWLGINFPNHKQAIEEELDKLKSEIKAQAPAILQSTLTDKPQPAQGL